MPKMRCVFFISSVCESVIDELDYATSKISTKIKIDTEFRLDAKGEMTKKKQVLPIYYSCNFNSFLTYSSTFNIRKGMQTYLIVNSCKDPI